MLSPPHQSWGTTREMRVGTEPVLRGHIARAMGLEVCWELAAKLGELRGHVVLCHPWAKDPG